MTKNDELALTPAHFLIGEPLIAPLARDHTNTPSNRLNYFKLIEKCGQEFWQRWSEEYVKLLIPRPKWRQSHKNIVKNDIVRIITENMPPTKWPLGRVMETYPDKEGRVPVVDVWFNGTTSRRPISKLCLLPPA